MLFLGVTCKIMTIILNNKVCEHYYITRDDYLTYIDMQRNRNCPPWNLNFLHNQRITD